MKGLLVKDFIMMKRHCLLLFIACFLMAIVGAVSDGTSYFLTIYPPLLMGVVPVTLLAYDEREKWTQYSACLPYTRGQLVLVKYLDALILSTAVAVVSLIVRLIAGRMNVAAVAGNWAFGLIYVTLLLPVAFRFGTEKARIAQLFGIGAIAGGSVVFSDSIITFEPPAAAGIVGVVLVLFVLSFLLASALYKKREL